MRKLDGYLKDRESHGESNVLNRSHLYEMSFDADVGFK